ncbi:hypothetical protein TPHA_0J02840 [Tetrapisispora phaffii CBS 4417]|uniref:Pre-mRNA-splicing factor n=1 Tax=Tetrapisispora phaffii (strain ATCC 24235 / CBS 4417 / NBRC 1672 / NRRL Y-8282 / UCD 70-5) TaxID=1071381 RepID=G8BZ13_TETPH|nr:hypothetical protein TPHA_0J02840 [Tetrapisispora phaffii CBS 4417]CCE65105.1 hypothetical protein TPHA_0J02840 [Tetrapisispora phaffii CBS 4417]
MSGFSINLKKGKLSKSKSNKKSKMKNLFLDSKDNNLKKKTKMMLTHFDDVSEPNEPVPLVIKPVPNQPLIPIVDESNTERIDDASIKYGLNTAKQYDDETTKGISSVEIGIDYQNSIMNKHLEQLPEITKEEEYDEVPIEEFGHALLRGMGWDGKDDNDYDDDKKKNKSEKLPHQTVRAKFSGIGTNVTIGMGLQEGTFMPLKKIERNK